MKFGRHLASQGLAQAEVIIEDWGPQLESRWPSYTSTAEGSQNPSRAQSLWTFVQLVSPAPAEP